MHSGLSGLDDEQRPDRPRVIDHNTIITATLLTPAEEAGRDALVLPRLEGFDRRRPDNDAHPSDEAQGSAVAPRAGALSHESRRR